MAISHINVISIPVSDQEVAKDFYVNKLGLDVAMDTMVNETLRWLQLRLPNSNATIAIVAATAQAPAGSVDGLVFEVDDWDATIADLQAKGVTIPEVESAPWGSWISMQDADGNHMLLQKSTTDYAS
jgi:catechol 2,3-dioxygenase-like lactoylglutathione lyase family enzyme